MDPVINSLVQSPLCRMLETLPVKGQSFTYQIADNVPPHSNHKIVVDAQEGAGVNHFQKRLHFNVPQFGYLSKAVLKFTSKQPLVNKSVAYANTSSSDNPDVSYIPHTPKYANTGYAATVTPNAGIGLVEKAELMTRNRTIETCYGRQIFQSVLEKDADNSARHMKMAQWHWEESGLMCMSQVSNVHGTAGSLIATNDDNLWPTPAGDSDRKEIVSYCELPFSVTQDMAHTLNTRFVEPLVVRINTHGKSAVSPDLTQDLLDGGSDRSLKCQLICYFTNFHDNTEQEIRNMNFKPEVPAGILAYDIVEEQPKAVTGWNGKATIGGVVGDGTDFYARDSYSGGDVIMPITSNNLATQIITCFDFDYRDPQAVVWPGQQDPSRRGYLPLSCWKGCRSFKLKGNGQELISSTGVESMLIDSSNEALSSHVRNVGNSSALYGLVQQAGAALSQKLTSLTPASSLKFGFCNSDAYNSGALALQTISNPHIVAQPYLHADQHPISMDSSQAEYYTRNSGYDDLKMFSYVKHFALLQIDSGTGAISRGVDA